MMSLVIINRNFTIMIPMIRFQMKKELSTNGIISLLKVPTWLATISMTIKWNYMILDKMDIL